MRIQWMKVLAVAMPMALSGALVGLVAPGPFSTREARAKSSYESGYGWEQTWNTALRLLRVDLGYKIVEKDEKAGYVLFEYSDKGSDSSASLELLRSEKSIRVVCQIPKFPAYHETLVLDRLARKLKDEYGPPPDRSKPPPADAGTPDGGDAAP